jgi:nitroimidazol reductase NimA-like FMN-containing flavoprotein (pyridoxamine 5'-phosphate oxidase superfamily)
MLARNNVGRMAFTFHDRVDIEPINYLYADNWLYGRTSHGTKLTILGHHQWVAFEVDEVAGLFEWRSVVVKGVFEIISAGLWGEQTPAYTHALELLRTLAPDAGKRHDRAAFRNVLFRIHVDEIIGRESTVKHEKVD